MKKKTKGKERSMFYVPISFASDFSFFFCMFLFFEIKYMRTRRRNEEYVLALLLLFFIFAYECALGIRMKMREYLLFERKASKC